MTEHIKICTKCGIEKPATTEFFYKKKTGRLGLHAHCKVCDKTYREKNKEKIAEKHCEYYQKNKEKFTAQMQAYRENNKDKIAAGRKAHYENNKDKIAARNKAYRENNKEKLLAQKKEYYEKNKDKISAQRATPENRARANKYKRSLRKSNVQFKLRDNLRSRLHDAIKNGYKAGSAVRDLGCTIEELKQHLEAQFKPGMTWDNWAFEGWHVDHIVPLASFDLTDREQFLKACHYTNLQPLWAADNLKKWAKYEDKIC